MVRVLVINRGFELSARYEEFCSGISLSGNLGESKPLERLGVTYSCDIITLQYISIFYCS